MLGVLAAVYFGAATNSSVNLNWQSFGEGNSSGWRVISYLVMLFPALDVLTIASVTLVATGSNLLSSFYGPRVASIEASSWGTVIIFRLVSGIIPLTAALLVQDFGVILSYTGGEFRRSAKPEPTCCMPHNTRSPHRSIGHCYWLHCPIMVVAQRVLYIELHFLGCNSRWWLHRFGRITADFASTDHCRQGSGTASRCPEFFFW